MTVVLLYAAFAALWILLSDKAVEWLFTDHAQFILASTVKGWAFVAVTSLPLYGLMQRLLSPPGAASTSVAGLRPLHMPLGLLSVAFIIMTGGGIAHTVGFQKDREVARLRAIADLKTRQIADWLRERYGDARFVQTSPLWINLYCRWRDTDDEPQLPEKAEAALLRCGCERILVVDDEPALANVTKQMLERLGYEVESLTNVI